MYTPRRTCIHGDRCRNRVGRSHDHKSHACPGPVAAQIGGEERRGIFALPPHVFRTGSGVRVTTLIYH